MPLDHANIRDALAGLISPDELTAEEQIVDLEEFSDKMCNVSPEEEAFFEERRRSGKGVGLDENDNLVYQSELKTNG